MNPINGLASAIVQSTQVQQRQSTDKQRQIRRSQNLSKDSGLIGDQLEHQVESTDMIRPGGDGQPQQRPPFRQPGHAQRQAPSDDQDQPPHLDLRA